MTGQFAAGFLISRRVTRNYWVLPVAAWLPPDCFFARQASEQYLTSSQVLAQRLRQVISRPQTRHGLRGSDDLLPLKPKVFTRACSH